LLKCGSRLRQVREQEEKYISKRETHKKGSAQIWGNRLVFAASKASPLGEQGRKSLLCSTKLAKNTALLPLCSRTDPISDHSAG